VGEQQLVQRDVARPLGVAAARRAARDRRERAERAERSAGGARSGA
jgi:hypothetical protein